MTRIGEQRPRLSHLPADIDNTEAGDEVIEFARRYGMILDDWQQWVVRHMCAERADGSWSATQSVLLVPRQAGKSAILETIEMAAMFLWDEQHVIYSAHLGKTAGDHMRRMRRHIDTNPDFRRIARVLTGKGDEHIERTDTGAILEFITRGKKTARGGSPNRVIFDEAMFLTDDQIQAMLPAMSAQSMNEDASAQMIYASSAPIEESEVLHRLRKRGMNDEPPRMFFAEWSAPEDCDPADRDYWYMANPGLGLRISEEWVTDNEFGTLSPEAFGVERLGIPQEPLSDDEKRAIPLEIWDSLARKTPADGLPDDMTSSIESHRQWAVACSSDFKWTTIAIAGRRADGLYHVESMDRRAETNWVVGRIVEGWEAKRIPIRIHTGGAEKFLILKLRERGVEVVEVSTNDYGAATGDFVAAANEHQLRHLGQPPLDKALSGAVLKVSEGGSSVWSEKKSSSIEISPLKAVTVALGGVPATELVKETSLW